MALLLCLGGQRVQAISSHRATQVPAHAASEVSIADGGIGHRPVRHTRAQEKSPLDSRGARPVPASRLLRAGPPAQLVRETWVRCAGAYVRRTECGVRRIYIKTVVLGCCRPLLGAAAPLFEKCTFTHGATPLFFGSPHRPRLIGDNGGRISQLVITEYRSTE